MAIKLPMKLFAINSVGTFARAVVAWPMLLVSLYMLAALVGSMIPRNADWRETPDGQMIWLHNNGIHTSIIVQCAGEVVRDPCLFPLAPASAAAQSRGIPTRYQMIGWGDREFYLNTPTWSALRPHTAIAALAGSGHSLVHVSDLVTLPMTGIKPVRISENGVLTLYDALLSSAAQMQIDGVRYRSLAGYGPHDRFYLTGTQPRIGTAYSLLFTCNNWVSDILATAGIRTALWSPFPGGVMHWH